MHGMNSNSYMKLNNSANLEFLGITIELGVPVVVTGTTDK